MKFYPSVHPSNPEYPSENKRFNEEESRRRRILKLREDATRQMNPAEARKLNDFADQLAQEQLPLKTKKTKRQTRLFTEGLD